MKNKIVSLETRNKMSIAVKARLAVHHHMTGVQKSLETKLKLSNIYKEKYKINKHPWLGRHHSDETKQKNLK